MMLLVASVITIGEMRSLATPTPLSTPTPAPTASAAISPGRIFAACPCVTVVNAKAAAVSTQATDRSIPPASMTSVCPIEIMPRNDDSLRSCSMFAAEA